MIGWVDGLVLAATAIFPPFFTRTALQFRPRLPQNWKIALDLWLAAGWTMVLAGISQILFADPNPPVQLVLLGGLMLMFPAEYAAHRERNLPLEPGASTIEAGAIHEPDPKSLSTQRAGRE